MPSYNGNLQECHTFTLMTAKRQLLKTKNKKSIFLPWFNPKNQNSKTLIITRLFLGWMLLLCLSAVWSLLSEPLEITAQRKKMKAFFLNQLQCHKRETENNAFKVQGVSRESDSNMRLTAVMSTLILHTHPREIHSRPVSYYCHLQAICLCICVRTSCVKYKNQEQMWVYVKERDNQCCAIALSKQVL